MARRHRHGNEFNVRTENYFYVRDKNEKKTQILLREEFNRTLTERINRIAELLNSEARIVFDEYEHELRLAKDEEKVTKEMFYEFFDWKKEVLEAFVKGVEGRMRYVVRMSIHELLRRAYAEAYFRVKFEKAWEWRGFLVQAYFDRMYNVIVESVPEAMEVLLNAVRYSNRFVDLIQGHESEVKSLAHEYLSWLRPKRCHQSAMLIRVTPLTMKFLKDREGYLYTAIHMSAKHLAYNPYSRNTIPRPYHFTILNRRKGTEKFSTKLKAGWTVIRLNNFIATAIDHMDRIYAVRRIAETILRPYVILKDRARTLGRPELRFNVEHCSVYAKLGRKIKSRKLDRLDDAKRFLEKRKIYMREDII